MLLASPTYLPPLCTHKPACLSSRHSNSTCNAQPLLHTSWVGCVCTCSNTIACYAPVAHISRAGQNHIYTVYTGCFWQGFHQI